MNMNVALYRFAHSNLTLEDCLMGSFARLPMQGLAQTPRVWELVEWDGQDLLGPVDIDQVYEVRLFCAAGELRWLRDAESVGQGRAAWISECADVPEGFAPVDTRELEPLDGQILSYGDGIAGEPVHDGVAGYAIREYIGQAPGTAGEDGNMIVVEQRILRVLSRIETGAVNDR